jgi:hypothetical protein
LQTRLGRVESATLFAALFEDATAKNPRAERQLTLRAVRLSRC